MRKALTILCLLFLWHTCGALPPQDGITMLAGKDKVALEEEFWDGLLIYRPIGKAMAPVNPRRIDKNLYVSENGWYESESIQNTAFFRKALFSWYPICESAFPVESVMTLLTGHTGKKTYSVHLLQHRYKFGTAETDVPLALLLEYCRRMGCTPFVGIESQDEGRVIATLFMVNAHDGYCHTFKFTIDTALLDAETGEVQAEAYTFTPINNLKQ